MAFCFSFCDIAVLVASDEPRGNWPGTGAVRGRRSPGHGYGREQNVFQCIILLKFIDFSDACDIIILFNNACYLQVDMTLIWFQCVTCPPGMLHLIQGGMMMTTNLI